MADDLPVHVWTCVTGRWETGAAPGLLLEWRQREGRGWEGWVTQVKKPSRSPSSMRGGPWQGYSRVIKPAHVIWGVDQTTGAIGINVARPIGFINVPEHDLAKFGC